MQTPTTTQQIIQILEAAPVAPALAANDAFACYIEGLNISADYWHKVNRAPSDVQRRAVYGALTTVCGEGAPKLINAMTKALFNVDGFNLLANCEVLALYHWIKPFRSTDHWGTAVQAVYECVGRVRAMVKTVTVEGTR